MMTTTTERLALATLHAANMAGLGGFDLIAELEGLKDARSARHSVLRVAALDGAAPSGGFARGTNPVVFRGPAEGSASPSDVTR